MSEESGPKNLTRVDSSTSKEGHLRTMTSEKSRTYVAFRMGYPENKLLTLKYCLLKV